MVLNLLKKKIWSKNTVVIELLAGEDEGDVDDEDDDDENESPFNCFMSAKNGWTISFFSTRKMRTTTIIREQKEN